MKFHQYAEIFPLIEGTDFDALVSDIKEHGQREKIVLHGGKILDGRNRFLACQRAKLKPKYRQFKGDDAAALAFIISANVTRRHLTESQRAMAAARIAALQKGSNQHAQVCAPSQTEAADTFDVSRRSVQHARKVIEDGSKALQQAVDSGEVSVSKAASVVELPKSEQLAAAKAKPSKPAEAELPERWEPEEDEAVQLEQAEKEYTASIDKVMSADDKLAAAHAEIKRQAAEIASLKLSRDSYQNRCAEAIERLKKAQRTIDRLERKQGRAA